MATKYVGCNATFCMKSHIAKGFCRVHYWNFINYGDPHITKIKLPWPNWLREARKKQTWKAAAKKWFSSEKGKVYTDNYKKTDAYKKTRKNNNSMESTKIRKLKYRQSDKGQEAIKRNGIKRRAKIKQATPSWVNKQLISYIYETCPRGMHVDHIVPLMGENVSGLHVPWNLQYMLPNRNRQKGNKYEK